MRSILVLLEDMVQREFGSSELASVRAISAERLEDAGRQGGAAGRVTAFVDALVQMRHRPSLEVYTFVGLKLVPPVLAEFKTAIRGHESTRSVLLQITRVAPQLLDVLVPGTELPDFDVELVDLETMRVTFHGTSEAAALFEGAVMGLGNHFHERVEARRVSPPSFAPDRRMIDVKIFPERRAAPPTPAPTGQERRRFFGA
jgi:hypothetical protein